MDVSRIAAQFDAGDWACVIIRINRGTSSTHTGIAYREIDPSQIVMTHMVGHEKFVTEQLQTSYMCVSLGLDPVLAESLADYCGRIARANESVKIPYDFLYGPYDAFDYAGKWKPRYEGAGLNCASFVVCLFASYRMPLVSLDGWPKRADDAEFQSKFADAMIASPDPSTKSQGFRIKSQAGRYPRVKPHEVAAAAAIFESGKTADYKLCVDGAKVVFSVCESHLRTNPPILQLPT